MDNFLIDRETLSKFVDELIKQNPLPVDNAEELNSLREDSIKALDDRIGQDIFSQLTEEQDAELRRLLEDSNESEDTFRDFFKKAGINLESTIAKSMREFAEEFLERRQNA